MIELFEVLNIDFEHEDTRGKLTQLIHGGYSQVNILETKKDVTRGGHYHKVCHEAFYIISGSVEVTLKSNDKIVCTIFKKNDFFCINPLVIHSMYFPEECLLVQMYDIPVEMNDGIKDIFSE